MMSDKSRYFSTGVDPPANPGNENPPLYPTLIGPRYLWASLRKANLSGQGLNMPSLLRKLNHPNRNPKVGSSGYEAY